MLVGVACRAWGLPLSPAPIIRVVVVAQSHPGIVARSDGEHYQGREIPRVLSVLTRRNALYTPLRPVGHPPSDRPGPTRSIRKRFVEEHLESGSEPLAWPLQGMVADIYRKVISRDEADLAPLSWPGRGCGCWMEKDAAEIVRNLVGEAESVLSRLHGH